VTLKSGSEVTQVIETGKTTRKYYCSLWTNVWCKLRGRRSYFVEIKSEQRGSSLQGHLFKMHKQYFKLDISKFFPARVIGVGLWNSLSANIHVSLSYCSNAQKAL